MITSASELSDFDIDDSPQFERMRRAPKVLMPTRSGGNVQRSRAKSKSRRRSVRGGAFPGAHQRRLRSV